MNKKTIILSVITIVGLGAGVYFWMLKNKRDKYASYDLTTGTSTFDPQPSAKRLEMAMKGLGTDEDMIWSTLGSLSLSQRKQVATYFNANYGNGSTLAEWFRGDLIGKDLTRALALLK